MALGRFGTILTHLYSPPFTVSNATFPNPADLVNYPSGDVLIGSAGASATASAGGKVTKASQGTVRARAVHVATGAKTTLGRFDFGAKRRFLDRGSHHVGGDREGRCLEFEASRRRIRLEFLDATSVATEDVRRILDRDPRRE